MYLTSKGSQSKMVANSGQKFVHITKSSNLLFAVLNGALKVPNKERKMTISPN